MRIVLALLVLATGCATTHANSSVYSLPGGGRMMVPNSNLCSAGGHPCAGPVNGVMKYNVSHSGPFLP